jgi:hypothetical protein
VRDDDRQRIRMFRTNVDEMNVHAVDRRREWGKAFSLASNLRQS